MGLRTGSLGSATEAVILERLGMENFDGLRADLTRLGIDADYEATGDLEVAVEPHEREDFEHDAEVLRRFGHRSTCSTRPRTARARQLAHLPRWPADRNRGRRSSIPASW